jgi:Fe-S cluster assembly protein SufD
MNRTPLPEWLANSLIDSLASQQPAAPGEIHTVARAQVIEWGLPTLRDEEWRWTNLRALTRPLPTSNSTAAPKNIGVMDSLPQALCIRFNAGKLVELPKELPDGMTLTPLQDADHAQRKAAFAPLAQNPNDALLALNTATAAEGLVINIAPNADISQPIVIEFIDEPTDTAAQTRILLRSGVHSRATLIETASSGDGVASWRNSVLVADLAANSQLTHLSLGLDGDARLLTDRSFVTLARDARYQSINIQLGGQLVRRDIDVNITETGAHCDLIGLMMPRAKQVLDTHTRLIHGAAHTTSNEQYQIIADESGRGIFKGRILVAQDAQKIEAFQNSRNLLLSDSAEIDTKPELEIYADDVKCSHGATIGRLDDEALYYLKSRGISSENARKLLITGFAQEIVDQLPTPELVAWLGQIIARRLERPQAK